MSEPYFQPDEESYEEGFVVVFNHIIINKELSDAAYRLLTYLHSNSATWTVYSRYTAKRLGWGREKLTKAIRELYNLGFITRIQTRDNGKFAIYTYKYSFKQKFKNEPWASPKKRVNNKPEMSPNVDEITSNTEVLSVEGLQPKPDISDPVLSASEKRSLTIPNKPIPNKPMDMEAMPASKKKQKDLDAMPGKKAFPKSKSRIKPRDADHEDRFQYLIGLKIGNDKAGYLDENAASYLSSKFTQTQIENAYFTLETKLRKRERVDSPAAVFVHLLKNEHNPITAQNELNETFAINFSKELGWSSLVIKQKIVYDRNNSAKDLSLNMPFECFKTSLMGLYSSCCNA